MSETTLVGGDVNVVVRSGDTVRRPIGPWSPAVHALLRHFEAVGFEGAPRFLSIDERGREVPSYIEGDPALAPAPNGADAVEGLGLLIRDPSAGIANIRWLEEHRGELEAWL